MWQYNSLFCIKIKIFQKNHIIFNPYVKKFQIADLGIIFFSLREQEQDAKNLYHTPKDIIFAKIYRRLLW